MKIIDIVKFNDGDVTYEQAVAIRKIMGWK